MTLQPSLSLAFQTLWRESPRWRTLFLLSLTLTALLVYQNHSQSPPQNSYTPPNQANTIPMVPPKAGQTVYTPPRPAAPSAPAYQTPSLPPLSAPLTVVAPAQTKIKPSQSADEIEVLSGSIKPRAPALTEPRSPKIKPGTAQE